MKLALAAFATVTLLVSAAAGRGEGASQAEPAPKTGAADWSEWTRPLDPRGSVTAQPSPAAEAAGEGKIDVVDAHWLALTMWGEARSGGEEAMRAVGHVVDNRRRAGRGGGWVSDTVSEAWQFSAWNEGDPNLRKMMSIDGLNPGTAEHEMWLAAKRIAGEILAGRSADPTGGALFYHTTRVAPRWSAGVTPSALIGGHLFFRTAR